MVWGTRVWNPLCFSYCIIQGKCCQCLWYVIWLCWSFGHPPTYFGNMSYHPTVLTFFFTIEVSIIRRHSSLSWWGRSSVLCMCWLTRGVSMVLVIWLLCLKSSSCWGELLFVVALICYGRLWISGLLLSIECHWRGECRSVLGWEPVASLIKTLKLWDKLSVWWSWWFEHGSNKSFILRTKTCEKTKYIFFVWNQFPNCCKAVQ